MKFFLLKTQKDKQSLLVFFFIFCYMVGSKHGKKDETGFSDPGKRKVRKRAWIGQNREDFFFAWDDSTQHTRVYGVWTCLKRWYYSVFCCFWGVLAALLASSFSWSLSGSLGVTFLNFQKITKIKIKSHDSGHFWRLFESTVLEKNCDKFLKKVSNFEKKYEKIYNK